MRGVILSLVVLPCLVLGIGIAATGQIKPWTEWSKKEAQKILDYSPWGQTQVLTDKSNTGFAPSTEIGNLSNAARLDYRIRLISAKPIRLAFLRLAQLDTRATPEQVRQMQNFVGMKFDDMIVAAVSFDSKKPQVMGAVLRSFRSGLTAILAQDTYIEVHRQPRNFLKEYHLPAADGRGAKFVFARMGNGEPFIKSKSGNLRFYARFPELPGTDAPVELDGHFKISEMTYEGILEY
jgi:hypothetical protein